MFAGIILKLKAAWAAWKWVSTLQVRGAARLTLDYAKRDRMGLEDWLVSLSDGKDMGRLETLLHSSDLAKAALLYGQGLLKSRHLAQITGEPDIQYLTKVEAGKILNAMDRGDRAAVAASVVAITQAMSTGGVPYSNYGKLERKD